MILNKEIVIKYFSTDPEDICFCGSNKQFKNCCLISYSKDIYHPTYLMSESLKHIKSQKTCLFKDFDSNCSGNIINAHSISLQYLKSISEKGHVLTFLKLMNATTLDENFDIKSLPEPEETGIYNTSIFSGLCKNHDDKLFESFEKYDFNSTNEQITDLHLRTCLKEIYVKKANLLSYDEIKNKSSGKGLSEEVAGIYYANTYKATNLSIADLYKELELTVSCRKNNENISNLIIELDGKPAVLNSSFVNPAFDLKGELIQDYDNENLFVRSFGFNVIPLADSHYYVFSWIDSEIINNYFSQVLERYNDQNLVSLLLQFSFLFSENSAIKASWWESLSLIKRKRLKYIFWNTVFDEMITDNCYSCLRTNMEFTETKILKVYKNF